MLVHDLKEQESFNAKMVSADVFGKTKQNVLKKLWHEAKSIEITLDFLGSEGVLGTFFKKFRA